jgi:prophage antirepressor-like protein
MSTKIQTQYFLGKPVRYLIDEKQNPWFLAMDVADILEYTDTQAMTRKLDEDEIQNRQIVGFGNRGVSLINESGLYSCILTCEKPQAKPFKKWVTNEVLPSIRKYGFYGAKEMLDDKEKLKALYARWDELKLIDKDTKKEVEDIKKQLRAICEKPYELLTAIPFPENKPLDK